MSQKEKGCGWRPIYKINKRISILLSIPTMLPLPIFVLTENSKFPMAKAIAAITISSKSPAFTLIENKTTQKDIKTNNEKQEQKCS